MKPAPARTGARSAGQRAGEAGEVERGASAAGDDLLRRLREAQMSVASSPPARRLERPRWLDPRLVVGVALVLVAVAVGAKVVGDAERGELVWSASRDLPAGTTLRVDDLQATAVRLAGSTGEYVDANTAPPDGYVLVRDVAAGELVPAAAVAPAALAPPRRLVSVPVAVHHFPSGLGRGHRVDVYVMTASASGTATATAPELVLADAAVAEVAGGSGGFGPSGGTVGIVLEVQAADAAAVVAAVATGTIQLVRVPGGS